MTNFLALILIFGLVTSECCSDFFAVKAVAAIVTLFGVVRSDVYTNYWAVHIEGGPEEAKKLAERHGFSYVDKIMPDFYHFQHRRLSKRSIFPSHEHHQQLALEPQVKWLEQQRSKRRVKRDQYSNMFDDPMWPRLWYLHRDMGLDMNVGVVYSKFNITGRGVSVSILDDGIEKDHPDLVKNYDPGASYDVNNHDSDPQPRYDFTNENRHGTRCAGEVAAQANNGICGIGIAFDAGIGGVRMLDGEVTDAVEAQSISLNPQHIDIYSASWGPDDDGRTVDGPGPLARKAFFDGITLGRRGLGSVFVWASGNGGRNGDSCACDGYTDSIYTLSISSSSENGQVPWYSEACASTLATTYSSGAQGERQILTTDLHHQCTDSHTGTSASAPLAAGIIALVLEANPNLTWRDLQHIVVLTAREANLIADDWIINGIGRKVSHHYGFGLMDAGAMVELAQRWKTVPEQHRCEITSSDVSSYITSMAQTEFTIESDGCEGQKDEVNVLEHVQAVVTLQTQRRGEVELYLTSPAGTKSILLARRMADTAGDGFSNWSFMTTHSWGEMASGTWKLAVRNFGTTSTLVSWSLVTFGTVTPPSAYLTTTVSNAAGPSIRTTSDVVVNNRKVKDTAEGVMIVCQFGQYLLNSSCYVDCPSGYFATNHTNSTDLEPSCISCHPSCARCTGPDSNQCLQCGPGYNLTGWSNCTRHSKAWWSTIRVGVMVFIACLLMLPVVICILVQVRSYQLRHNFQKREVMFVARNRNDGGHIPIEVSIDKPLLEVSSSDSEAEEYCDRRDNGRH